VIAIGRDMAQRLNEAGVDPARIRVVPNGSSVDWDGQAPIPAFSSRRFSALHAGEIGMRGAWQAMVDGARGAADVATLVFLGDGVEASKVRSMAADTSNVEFEERLPLDQLPRRLADADVLLVTVGRGAEGYSVPSKTYELFGCGKPIVVIADQMTECARLVTELDCGIVVSPDDGQEFADALRLLAGDADRRARLGANALKARDRFRRSDCLDQVVDILHEVITPDA
jgi:colanic acid biosynthesis glycosyl transferase WcaI